MEKITYKEFPKQAEVTKEGNLFFLTCALCHLDFPPLEARPPYIGVEHTLRQRSQKHNRQDHWPSLTSLNTP